MKRIVSLCVAALGFVAASSAHAAYSTVDLSGVANSYSLINNGTFPTGTTTGNQGLDVPFLIDGSDGNAHVWIAPGSNSVLTVPLSISGQATFYALLNNYYGTAGYDEYTITINTQNSGSFSYSAIGGVDTRDYNQNVFTNTLAPTTTPWFDNGQGQRFDLRQFTLPTSVAGDTVTSFVITQTSGDNAILAGLTFSTEGGVLGVPEPESWALMIVGFAAIGMLRRARPVAGFARI